MYKGDPRTHFNPAWGSNWGSLCFSLNQNNCGSVVHQVTGADLEGGTPGARPLYFLQGLGAWLCVGAPGKKNAPNCMNWLWKLQFFSASEGAHPPQTPPVPTGAVVLSALNLGTPSFKKILDLPLTGTRYTCHLHLFYTHVLQCEDKHA